MSKPDVLVNVRGFGADVASKGGNAASKLVRGTTSVAGDFAKFIAKGNVVEMAVGIVMGTAFTNIVNSFVKDMITPLMGLVTQSLGLYSLAIHTLETQNHPPTRDFFIALRCDFFFALRTTQRANWKSPTSSCGVRITPRFHENHPRAGPETRCGDRKLRELLAGHPQLLHHQRRDVRVYKPKADPVKEKACPFCCKDVPILATRCSFCTSQLPALETAQ
ncbi:MAG: large-conductance mechanosensitive channel [Olpidium bornovanus]|uniref:Large-conductance mechanosensitive channel n=1 Tax=Olpidium bornovanus TaxID=278681 RepID=A0A8H8DGU7_9FUNG|nr:MAG: large-conductance mechanosensitive channel [Olpidium bornovanus]